MPVPVIASQVNKPCVDYLDGREFCIGVACCPMLSYCPAIYFFNQLRLCEPEQCCGRLTVSAGVGWRGMNRHI